MTTPNSQPLLRELINIPEYEADGDLVLKLSSGVLDAEATLRDYVITPALVENFDEALSLVKSAVTGQESKAAYLHGSFGSGKSHFMAVLHALLRGEPAARQRGEFAPLLAKHDWVEGKKFLLVPVYMLDAKSIEQKVFSTYIDYVRRLHPDAPIPAVHRTDALLEEMRDLRKSMGDERFLAGLPGGTGKVNKWGKPTSGWTPESLDAAMAAGPEDELRKRLVSDLLQTWKKGFFRDAQQDAESYIDLTSGLKEISRHAKSLGYDSLILFLDELVLWLITSAGDSALVAREIKKVTLFVEGGDPERAIPIVSLIARQRDLRDVLGEKAAGSSELEILEALDFQQGRFGEVTLSDTNLPVIAQERVLKPVSAEADEKISAAFEMAKRLRTWDILLGSGEGANAAAFRKTYPFSPAFLGTLVNLSAALQRSRTAIKLMRRLLIRRRAELRLGQLIPLGDLYDVLAEGGVEPFTKRLRTEFNAAQQLYQTRLRPYLLDTYGLTDEEVAAAQRGQAVDNAAKIRAFLGDDRLVKTLLLSALAPAEPALQNLTATRLSALNHGAVTSPIQGQEVKLVAGKVQGWASQFPEIKYTPGDDPGVALELVGVDIDSILERASHVVNVGNRKNQIRDLLCDEFGITKTDQFEDRYDLVWRGSKRSVEVKFGNVRDTADLHDDAFTPDGPSAWRLLIDYPFDSGDKGPSDDRARVQSLRDRGFTPQTVCWLPAFLTAERMRDLDRLVAIEFVLNGQRLEEYADHLSPDDRHRARQTLTGQRGVLVNRITETLRQAYGLISKQPGDIVGGYDDHLETLDTVLKPRLASGAAMSEALRHLADQMLSAQYPGHPRFDRVTTQPVKIGEVKTVLGYVRAAADQAPTPADVPKPDRDAMRRLANELQIGELGEAKFTLGSHWRQHFARAGVSGDVTVTRLRELIDSPEPMGLDPIVADMVIIAWAEQTDRGFVEHGGLLPSPPEPGRIKPGLLLREQQLPSPEQWEAADARAQKIFGYPPQSYRRARLAAMFADKLSADSRRYRDAVQKLVVQLEAHRDLLGLTDATPRLRTARVAEDLLDQLGSRHGKLDIIGALADVELDGPAERLSRSIKGAADVARALEQAPWPNLQLIARLAAPYAADAQEILERLREAASSEELTTPLENALSKAGLAANALIQRMADDQAANTPIPSPPSGDRTAVSDIPPPAGGTTPGTGPVPNGPIPAPRSGRSVRSVSELANLAHELQALYPGKRVEVTWQVVD